jgi:hypothetical protein
MYARHIMNGRTPLYLTAIAAAIMAAGVLILQPYSVRSPWDAYTDPVHRYLSAALASDSSALARQSLDPHPVAWALALARRQPDSLAVWAREAVAWGGTRHADTADVFVSPPQGSCSLVMRFVGPARQARVQGATANCFAPR